MSNNFIQKGDTLTYEAGAAAKEGDVVILGELAIVNAYDVSSGDSGEGHTTGVFELSKKASDAPAQFTAAYWDESKKYVTTTGTGNKQIGIFAEAGVASADTVLVKLYNPFVPYVAP
ncbi:hypothetical protein A134_23105 [Vibrio crassostreae 9CS106]|uniref:DUF2190 domain-containing protein n=1 Tax=Vibrio crassostreae 9CS106 TaxID=1191300 RepID=A0A1B1C3A6_9VIBR|nr:hypothetical protein A134_23105 [Vibrio crassostreae 9CS106]